MTPMKSALNRWIESHSDISILHSDGDISTLYSCILETGISIDRIFAMPSKDTFTIKPIRELIAEEVDKSKLWIDPFAGYNSPAQITNDINPAIDTDYHMEALDFLKMFDDNSADGVFCDPPYSSTQELVTYGVKSLSYGGRSAYNKNVKVEIARILKPGGKAICFGFNSVGIGKSHGFTMKRILMVEHGGSHNDTIVTVETKD